MADKPVYTVEQIITELTTHFSGWSPRRWDGAQVTYWLPTSPPLVDYSPAPELSMFASASGIEAAVDAAFALWDDLIPQQLVKVASGGDIAFAYSASTTDSGTYAMSTQIQGVPAGDTGLFDRGWIWLNNSAGKWPQLAPDKLVDSAGLPRFDNGFRTLVHEIGHTLGLSHPGEYDASDGTLNSYNTDALFQQDQRHYTVMSYFGGYNRNFGWVLNDVWDLTPTTPMLYDIAAIQDKYGADPTTRTGDTRYGHFASADVPGALNFARNLDPIVAIYDAGGIDTLDVSLDYNRWIDPADHSKGTEPVVYDQRMDLRPGSYSSVAGLKENVAIAFNTLIENAASASGNDTLIGNAVGNHLEAGAGNDLLEGAEGDDVLIGGSGHDRLVGGPGNDTLIGDGDGSGATADSDVFVFSPGGGADTIIDFGVSGAVADLDRLDLDAFTGLYSFDDLLARAVELPGVGVRLDLSGTDQVLLQGLSLSQLKPTQFTFHEAPAAGGEFTPFDEGAFADAQLAALPGGRFVMVWTDSLADGAGGDGSGSRVAARIFDVDGRAGPVFQVNDADSTAGDQSAARVATLADGSFVVVYRSDENRDGTVAWLNARVFGSDGTPLGDDFAVNAGLEPNVLAGGNGAFGVLDVEPAGASGFSVVWLAHENKPFGITADLLRMRSFADHGDVAGTEVTLLSSYRASAGAPDLGRNYHEASLSMQGNDTLLTVKVSDMPGAESGVYGLRGGAGQTPSTLTPLIVDTSFAPPLPNLMRLLRGLSNETVPLGDSDHLLVQMVELNASANAPAQLQGLHAMQLQSMVIGAGGIGIVNPLYSSALEPHSVTDASFDRNFRLVFGSWINPTVDAAQLADGSVLVAYTPPEFDGGYVGSVHVAADGTATPGRTLTGWPSVLDPAHGGGKLVSDVIGLDDGRAVVTWTDVRANRAAGGPQALILGADLLGVTLAGTDQADRLVGSGWDDRISGFAGDDTLIGRAGADRLDGGEGLDRVDYGLSLEPVDVSLSLGGEQSRARPGSHSAGDTLISIEALRGSAYDDWMLGGPAAEHLDGQWGDDQLVGQDGDTLVGGPGADVLLGDDGLVLASYRDAPGPVSVDLGRAGVQGLLGDALGDRISGVRALEGSDHADTLVGDAGPNRLIGGPGDDMLDGGADGPAAAIDIAVYRGPRALYDVLPMDDGGTLVVGPQGNDRLYRVDRIEFADETLDLAPNRPPLPQDDGPLVLQQDDRLLLDAAMLLGNDTDPDGDMLTLLGVAGAAHGSVALDAAGRVVYVPTPGYTGPDEVDVAVSDGTDSALSRLQLQIDVAFAGWRTGGGGPDVLTGDLRVASRLYGGAGDDVLTGGLRDDELAGGAGTDRLVGGAGNDRLLGGEGNDELSGGTGDDRLQGGGGNDALTGGWGADTFVYRSGDGADRVLDFALASALGNDHIELQLPGVDNFADLMALARPDAGGTLFDFGGGDSLLLVGVAPAALVANGFVFG